MRLMSLPDAIQKQIEDGSLTAGHARSLIATESPIDLADKIIALNLTVRQAEDLARGQSPKTTNPAKLEKDADTRALEKNLSEALGLGVAIKHTGTGGAVNIQYKNLDQLDEIVRRLTGAAG